MGSITDTLLHVYLQALHVQPYTRHCRTGSLCSIASCRDLPIIPTRHRSSAGQLHLAAPKALFDPRNSIFRELLDPLKHFPAPPFDGSDGSVAAAVSAGDGAGNDVGGGQGGGSTEMALTAVPVSAHAFSGSSKQLLSSLVECGLKTRLDLQVR